MVPLPNPGFTTYWKSYYHSTSSVAFQNWIQFWKTKEMRLWIGRRSKTGSWRFEIFGFSQQKLHLICQTLVELDSRNYCFYYLQVQSLQFWRHQWCFQCILLKVKSLLIFYNQFKMNKFDWVRKRDLKVALPAVRTTWICDPTYILSAIWHMLSRIILLKTEPAHKSFIWGCRTVAWKSSIY